MAMKIIGCHFNLYIAMKNTAAIMTFPQSTIARRELIPAETSNPRPVPNAAAITVKPAAAMSAVDVGRNT